MSNRPSKKPSHSVQRSAAARARGAEDAPRRRGWIIGGIVAAVVVVAGIVAFVATRSSEPVLDAQATRGKQLVSEKGCASCHTTTGSRSEGPTFKGLYGKTEQLTDGTSVTVDDAYIRQSIREPRSQIVAGFEKNVMPTPEVTDEEIAQITAYLKAIA